MTVIVANDQKIVILILSLHNFQLVHEKVVESDVAQQVYHLKEFTSEKPAESRSLVEYHKWKTILVRPLGLVLGFWQVPGAYQVILSYREILRYI